MTAKDVMKMFELMQDFYPRDNSLFVDAGILARRAKTWAERLADVPKEDGMNAVRSFADNSPFAPLVSDILEYHRAKAYWRYIEQSGEKKKTEGEAGASLLQKIESAVRDGTLDADGEKKLRDVVRIME